MKISAFIDVIGFKIVDMNYYCAYGNFSCQIQICCQ